MNYEIYNINQSNYIKIYQYKVETTSAHFNKQKKPDFKFNIAIYYFKRINNSDQNTCRYFKINIIMK